MRTTLNHSRLRLVALACWAFSTWFLVQGNALAPRIALLISANILALLLFAVGITFWLLGVDLRAGIAFDSKGLLLNLGHSASFIAWDNVARVGVSRHRSSLLALGSRQQLGIVLREVQPYIQSYEERLPAARGPLAWALRQIEGLLRPFQRANDAPLAARMEADRARTGYDVLVPEAFLGRSAEEFAALVESYRVRPTQRRTLPALVPLR